VHLSDLSWNETGEAAVRNYKKGQEVDAIVLAVDVDRERISLGIKQLDGDPFATFTSVNDKGAAGHRQGQDRGPAWRRDRPQRRRDRLPARQRAQPRPRGRCAQRAEGRRRSQLP
jgi:predicted RNA-binding protein with RPS1 domain